MLGSKLFDIPSYILGFTDFATFISSKFFFLGMIKPRESAFQVNQYIVTKCRQAGHPFLRNSCLCISMVQPRTLWQGPSWALGPLFEQIWLRSTRQYYIPYFKHLSQAVVGKKIFKYFSFLNTRPHHRAILDPRGTSEQTC